MDPLQLVFPLAEDRAAWCRTATVTAADTGSAVHAFEHRAMGRTLRLDEQGRVYGQDAEGAVRLFGRGGPLALAVALNAIYDGFDEHRPGRVHLHSSETANV